MICKINLEVPTLKHALIITSYNDFDILIKLLKYYSHHFDCYLHIDKKSNISRSQYEEIKSIPNTFTLKKYRVNWGSYSHIKAVLALIALAVSNTQYDFYHIMTGNSFPVTTYIELDDFFEQHSNNNFMEIVPLDGNPSKKDLEEWFYYFRFPFLYNKKGENSDFWNQLEYNLVKIQKKLGMKRSLYYPYKGYFYCHLTHDFVIYILDYIKRTPSYIQSLKYCHVCEEFFFQNIIMSSPFKETIIPNHLFFNIWSSERGNPAILIDSDFQDIIASGAFFARKCGEDSIPLLNRLLKNISESSTDIILPK